MKVSSSREKSRMVIGVWHIVLGVCIFALSAFYLYQVNGANEDRFAVERLESQIQELRDKDTALALVGSENYSLQNLQAKSAALRLVDVGEVSYIKIKSHAPLVINQ